MKPLLPRSLFSQIVLLLFIGFAVSQAAGWWIYSADRDRAVRAVGGFATAQRVANLARLMREAPPEWRERLASAVSDDSFRVRLSREPVTLPPSADGAVTEMIADYLAEQLGERLGAGFQISVGPAASFGPPFGHGPMAGFRPMAMHGLGAYRELQVAMPLADGQWLSLSTSSPDTGPAFSGQFLSAMAVMAMILLGIGAWAARRVTAPLAALSQAAERLGRDVTEPGLPEEGTTEMRQAAAAFNKMQRDLRAFIDNRTGLLAAISHDLRTPLTLLRLRTEHIDDVAERDKMLATIAEMESLIGATLDFARGAAMAELRRPTDVTALLQTTIDDMTDAGLPATMKPAEPIVATCRPAALKRAVVNLLDNAVRHGKAAHCSIAAEAKSVIITIDDEGPGIPEAELERVFEPFFRLDPSRGRDSGGVGLGLAIARSIVMAEGGTISLSNPPGGGLRAQLTLPL